MAISLFVCFIVVILSLPLSVSVCLSVRCPMLHKSKHIQLKNKRASLQPLTELPPWPSGKGVGLNIWWGFYVHGQFFFLLNDDGGASRSDACEPKARALMRVQSTKPEGAKRPRMRAQSAKSRERNNQELECKAQSLREQSDRVDVPE